MFHRRAHIGLRMRVLASIDFMSRKPARQCCPPFIRPKGGGTGVSSAYRFYATFCRFRAIASSTARSCFKSSSRRVVFFEFADDEDWVCAVELDDGGKFTADDDDLLSTWAGDRFFSASIFLLLLLLLTTLRSGTVFSRRTLCLAAVRDELLELDEYDEPVSEPLESDEAVKVSNIGLTFCWKRKDYLNTYQNQRSWSDVFCDFFRSQELLCVLLLVITKRKTFSM